MPLSEAAIDRVVAASVDPDDLRLRSPATQALAALPLTFGQAQRVLDSLESVYPSDLLPAITAIARVNDERLDRQLMNEIEKLPGIRSIAPEALLQLFGQRPAALRELAERAVATLRQPPAEIAAALDELAAQLPTGNPLDGMQVFRAAPAHCSVCHQVAYVGGMTGPDLSRIGAVRTRRELLEALAYPNLRLEQSYRSTKLATADGKTFHGLIEREDAESLDLVTGPDQRVRLAVADIEERSASDVSIMPSGLCDQLTRQQLADLLAFLESRQ
jgi:putative heme-binding domain-containing protein